MVGRRPEPPWGLRGCMGVHREATWRPQGPSHPVEAGRPSRPAGREAELAPDPWGTARTLPGSAWQPSEPRAQTAGLSTCNHFFTFSTHKWGMTLNIARNETLLQGFYNVFPLYATRHKYAWTERKILELSENTVHIGYSDWPPVVEVAIASAVAISEGNLVEKSNI